MSSSAMSAAGTTPDAFIVLFSKSGSESDLSDKGFPDCKYKGKW